METHVLKVKDTCKLALDHLGILVRLKWTINYVAHLI